MIISNKHGMYELSNDLRLLTHDIPTPVLPLPQKIQEAHEPRLPQSGYPQSN